MRNKDIVWSTVSSCNMAVFCITNYSDDRNDRKIHVVITDLSCVVFTGICTWTIGSHGSNSTLVFTLISVL